MACQAGTSALQWITTELPFVNQYIAMHQVSICIRTGATGVKEQDGWHTTELWMSEIGTHQDYHNDSVRD